jgi:hypothetical protein
VLDAVVALRRSTYLGWVAACEVSLHGEPLVMHEIASLRLWVGDPTSVLAKTDGTTHRLYEKRTFRRPRLLLRGSISLRLSGIDDPLSFDVSDMVYLTLNHVE